MVEYIMIRNIELYTCTCNMSICICEGGFNTPTKHLQPLTQKSWFIKEAQMKELHQLLTMKSSSMVNLVNIHVHVARDTNVDVKLVENFHGHIKGMDILITGE